MNDDTLPIGLLAARAGVSVRTVRYYEERGLLRAVARRPSGYRRFDPRTAGVVSWIQHALSLGFHLGEIRALLDDTDKDRDQRDRASRLRERALAKVREMDAELARLTTARRALLALAECSCGAEGCDVLVAVGTACSRTGEERGRG